jgi:2-oxoisovalerate dehydrogenase E2 component (dihydrolipoyl transacylase)
MIQQRKPILAKDGHPVVRRVLLLTSDHRVVTGRDAARFLSAVRDDLEQPAHDTRE